jgi:predicted phosphate transport protein (TIGR00153 family)
MSLKGTISDRDAKKKALDLFEEQINKVQECVGDLEDIFEEFYEHDVEDCDEACEDLIKSESEADRLKEQLMELLFKGTFLPLTGEDRLNLVIMNDNVADAAEKTARVFKAYLPALMGIDKDIKYQIFQIAKKIHDISEHLAKALKLLYDDFEGAFKEAEMVEKMRRDVRHKGFTLMEQLFKQKKVDLSIALAVKEIILLLVNVANKAEDASDFVQAIVIKYSY